MFMTAGRLAAPRTWLGLTVIVTALGLASGPTLAQSSSSTTITAGPNPSVFGQAVAIHVTVAGYGGGAPTGNVNIYDTSIQIRTAHLYAAGASQSAIAVGDFHTCALNSAGGVQCWGYNFYGQLGDGTNTSPRLLPVDVSGLTSGVKAISAAGGHHSCALTDGGAVWCWGFNGNGELGDGSVSSYAASPVEVSGLTSGVTAISAGGDNPAAGHACAVTSAGGLKCWGFNGHGELGDGSTTNRSTPVDVTGLTSGVVAVAAGRDHTCALTSGGAVKCWGNNSKGQIGDGTSGNQRLTPVAVSGLASGVASISAGDYVTCVVTTAGGAKCWGENGDGQIGDGTQLERHTPVNVSGLTMALPRLPSAIRIPAP